MNTLKKHVFLLSCVLLVFFAFSFLYKSDGSFDQDLGRHLKLGEIISQNHTVPTTNLFSYTYPDFPFINHHYLFEVLIYQWSQIFNLESLLIVKILIILTSVIFTFLIIPKKSVALLLPVGFIFLHVLRERTDLRPEIFSFLFTSLTLFILEKFYTNQKSKLLFFIPLIQLLWINLHIYFFLGFILQFIYLVDLFFRKEFSKVKILLVIFGLSMIFSLINPNTIAGLLYPMHVFSNYGYTIAENQSIFLLESIGFKDHNFIFVKLCALSIIITFLVSLVRKPFIIKNNLILILGLMLALINIRSFPYLFFLSFPFILTNFDYLTFNKKSIFVTICISFLLIYESFLYLNGSYYRNIEAPIEASLSLRENGKNALDFVITKDLPQPIYNNFDIGSYLIYRGYPKFKVFVDGRPESYPSSFFENIYIPSQNDPQIFQQIDSKYNFQTIIFSITDQTPWGQSFLKAIVKNEAWSTIYLDDFIIILVKKEQLKDKNITLLDLNNLSPTKYSFTNYFAYLRISYFLQNIGYIASAKLFSEKALELNPESKITKSIIEYLTR